MSELLALLNTPVEGASKRKQMSIESPQAIEVISAEQIRASGAFRLIDVLRLATSIEVWDNVPDRANVTIRGVNPGGNGRTIQVLVDGVPLFNIVAAPLDFNGLPVPVDTIERVEIIRGPSSSLYGANAQLGVISITTKRAKEGFTGSLRAGGADHGSFREQAFAGYGSQAFSLTLGVASASDRDLRQALDYISRPGVTLPQSTARHELQAFVRPEFALGSNGKIWVAFGHGDSGHFNTTSFSPAAPYAPLAIFPNQTSTREIIQGGWSETWSPALRTELKLNQKTFNLALDPLRADPTNPASPATVGAIEATDPALATAHDFFHDRIREGSLQVNWDPDSSLHVVGGFDAKDIETGPCLTIGLAQERKISAAGGFASVDWLVGPVTLSAGARVANESLGGTSTSPRASVVWKLDDSTVIRAGYFTSTRSPMVQEKYSVILPNLILNYAEIQSAGLQSEKADAFELGFRKTWAKWSLDITGFYTTLKNLIVLTPTGASTPAAPPVPARPIQQFQNLGKDFKDSGIEASLTGELASGWLLGVNASTASFKDPIYQLDQQADYSPKSTANLWSRYRQGIFFAYGAVQYVGSYTVATPLSPVLVLRQDLDASTQVHFNLGLEPLKGLSVSAYGISALKGTTPSSNSAILNQFLIRYTRRELGLQAAYRF